MAKSSRSSAVKKNNQKLKKHVFGPVETARNERLSAKLLELASQPKPPRSEMEVERDRTSPTTNPCVMGAVTENANRNAITATANQEAKVGHGAEGVSSSLFVSIPASFLCTLSQRLRTPPATSKSDSAPTFPTRNAISTPTKFPEENLFFHLLGVATNVIGFNEEGNLALDFHAPT